MSKLSRRKFLGVTAAAAGASIAARSGLLDAEPAPRLVPRVAASDRVRFGIIGVGMQGSGLLAQSIRLPGVECAAAADLYDGRHVLAREIVRSDLPVTRRYQELLDNKDIDCIVAAVPDHWHKQILIDAVRAGKDVYCEKPMSHTAAEGVAMVEAAAHSGRVVQIGSQRVSSMVCAKAKDMIAQGMLGDLMLVEGWMGRNEPNGAWQYPPPLDLSPQNLDWDTWQGTVPKRAFNPLIFARWRSWKEYGTGVAGDLLVHLVSGMLFMLGVNEPPTQASALGGIRHWKDGRNMPDVHAVLYEYRDMPPVYMRLNLATAMTETYRIQGSRGLLEVTPAGVSFTPQLGVDTGPSYYADSFPQAMRAEYARGWHQEHDTELAKAAVQESVSFRMPNYDDLTPHLANFFDAVRTRRPVVEDVVFGHNAALACHMANESYFRKTAVTWDAVAKTIKG